MKKLFYLLAGIFSLILALALIVLGAIFVNPTILVNERNIKWALERTEILEQWSWKRMDIRHDWNSWNDRLLTGEIRDFCFRYRRPGTDAKSCFSNLSWDFNLLFSFADGFRTKAHKPFRIHSPEIVLSLTETPGPEEKSSPPDVHRWWSLLWSGMIPDMEVDLEKIKITREGKTQELDFSLRKKNKTLSASSGDYHLTADPVKFEVTAPEAFELPEKIKTIGPLYLRNVSLKGTMKPHEIPLTLTGNLEEALFQVTAKLPLPLGDFSSADFRVRVLSTVKANVRVPDFRKTYRKRAPAAFRELPAPLNVMDGIIETDVTVDKAGSETVTASAVTKINLSSRKEDLALDIGSDVDLPVMTMKPEEIRITLDFRKVRLELPEVSKKSPPPQFLPDKRFQKGPWKPEEKKRDKTDVLVHLSAGKRKSLQLMSNLLDEPLRLNFDLRVGDVVNGWVKALPLETTVFKRPVRMKSLKVTFDPPAEPVIDAQIVFPLPEYKITMNLEGPLGKPRYAFRSEPPLPQNDIYAVLLFGRPLQDLDPDDKTAAQRTNQIISQGLLSLSVLYFLAGSPVEYVGFDPDSQSATAQIGLGKKTSLRVGGGQEGMNAGGLRHSLGKGWYIDTGLEARQDRATEDRNNYGVLLERVIAY